ncbi:MAG TPA: S8 family serine peptidase [Ohtaekwangia sp.]
MKVTVTKFLNVRVGRPSVNAPCFQFLAPGTELEVDGKFYDGDVFDGSNQWMKDGADNYYWSGGLNIPALGPSISFTPFDEKDFWWLHDFQVGELWKKGLSGKGVKIAALDSGLSLPHPDLVLENENLFDVTNGPSGITDQTGHGTHVTGIMKGTNNGFGIKGIAFNANLFFAKITDDFDGDLIQNLVKGIDWAVQQKVDIISISQGFEENNAKLEQSINRAIGNNILVVCACGNKDGTAGNTILFPARFPNTLAIGGLQKNRTPLPDTINAAQVHLFAPGENILSTHLNGTYKEESGSSQATPFVTAIAALLLESGRKTNPGLLGSDIRKKLIDTAAITAFGKVIHPLKAFNS